MRLLCISVLTAAAVAISNVTFFGAPRFSLGDTLPNRDDHGNIVVAQDLGGAVEKPNCKGGSNANARSIAYYQEWNIRTRPCDKVWPSQIKLDGLNQLNLAFAYIDPATFKVRLENPQDDEIYRQFVELKQYGMQVWLGVGGWEFNDDGPTRATWSDMTGAAANRKAFITSTVQFLKEYGFQGLDVDWEWPASASRGGRPEDTQNQVTLMKELRDALGNDYGLTCVLPHDNTYLQGIDVRSLSQYVDWFNVLTYDLHGSWDEKNPALGAKIRPHTDLQEIDTHLEALWATAVDPSKFTLGLAYYGRGYTATDPGCLYYGCSFTGPSLPGNCSTQAGTLSGCEIKRIIKDKHLSPELIAGGASAMQLSWDDQWISYDNDQTFALKKAFANERCMGGTAVWAIDYDSCNDNGELPPLAPVRSSVPSITPTVSDVVSSIQSSNMDSSTSRGPLSDSSPTGLIGTTSSAAPMSPTVVFTSLADSSIALSSFSPSSSSRIQPSRTTTAFATSTSPQPSTKSPQSTSLLATLSMSRSSVSDVSPSDTSTSGVSSSHTSTSGVSSSNTSTSGTSSLGATSSNVSTSGATSLDISAPGTPFLESQSTSYLPSSADTSPVLSFSLSGDFTASLASSTTVPTVSLISGSSSSSSIASTDTSTTFDPRTWLSQSIGSSMLNQSSSAVSSVNNFPTIGPESSSIASSSSSVFSASSSGKNSTPSVTFPDTSVTVPVPILSFASITNATSNSFPWNSILTSAPIGIVSSDSWTITPMPIVTCVKDCDTKDPEPTATRSTSPDESDDEFPLVPWLISPKEECPKESPRGKKNMKRGFFGCGCGWSGLDKGPGCPKPSCEPLDIKCWIELIIDILWWKITPCGQLFECNFCKWLGCPNVNDGCGLIGCDGFCNSENGCDPDCPEEVCGTCFTKGQCPRIKPGPPPHRSNQPAPTGGAKPSDAPITTRKPSCEPKDYVTATEVFSLCVKKTMQVNNSSKTTLSSCMEQSMTFGGCPPLKGFTATEWTTMDETSSCTVSSTVYSTFSSCLVDPDSTGGNRTSSCISTVSPIVGCDVTGGVTKTTSTTSKPGGCTLAPLVFGEDEGDNTGLPNNFITVTTGIPIPTLTMKANATSNDGSCALAPLIIDDDEGDNILNDNITIPTLSFKNNVTTYTKSLVAPTLVHHTTRKSLVAPTFSQTLHPTPTSSSTSTSSTPASTAIDKPIQAGGKWEIKIDHDLTGDGNRMHWTLYDSNQNEAGGGDGGTPIQCVNRPSKDCFPFDIQFSTHSMDASSKSRIDFEIMMNPPSRRRLKFDDRHSGLDLPEDGYPGSSYGCKGDKRDTEDGSGRHFWCSFQWLGAGGWDGESAGPVPSDI